jgi:hypothetical protein
MKLRMISLGTTSLLASSLAFAIPPVTLSSPTPAITSQYLVNSKAFLTYTISNYAPKPFTLTITGISPPVRRVQASSNDCGYGIPAGNPTHPSTCNIGISINPRASDSSSISQTLVVDYQGRTPLESGISFTISQFGILGALGNCTGGSTGRLFCDNNSGITGNYQSSNCGPYIPGDSLMIIVGNCPARGTRFNFNPPDYTQAPLCTGNISDSDVENAYSEVGPTGSLVGCRVALCTDQTCSVQTAPSSPITN